MPNSDKQMYRCDREDCGKEYVSLLNLRRHIAMHAVKDGEKECKICGQIFDAQQELVFHLKVHTSAQTTKKPEDKRFKCELCERRFFTRKDVRRHMVVHTKKRDFICQHCPQKFGRKDHLIRHMRTSHNANSSSGKTALPLKSLPPKSSMMDNNSDRHHANNHILKGNFNNEYSGRSHYLNSLESERCVSQVKVENSMNDPLHLHNSIDPTPLVGCTSETGFSGGDVGIVSNICHTTAPSLTRCDSQTYSNPRSQPYSNPPQYTNPPPLAPIHMFSPQIMTPLEAPKPLSIDPTTSYTSAFSAYDAEAQIDLALLSDHQPPNPVPNNLVDGEMNMRPLENGINVSGDLGFTQMNPVNCVAQQYSSYPFPQSFLPNFKQSYP